MTSAPMPATRVWQRAEPVTYSLVDWDVIVAGAGNAGMSAAHAARERGCRRARAREGRPGVVGRQLGVHGRGDPARARRTGGPAPASWRTTSASPSPTSSRTPRRSSSADMRRVTLGRGDPEMARILVARLRAPAVRWLREHGVRFRLMYERQSYEVDGRHRFWGGLALGTVDGGEGLMAQHRAAAERSGIELRHGAAVVDLRPAAAPRRARPARRGELRARAVVLAAGGFEANPRLRAALPRARTGTSRRSAGRRTTPARCWRRRSRTARRPTGTGAAATRSSGTPTRRRPATASSPTASRASPIRSGSSSTCAASASSTRARTSATTRTRSYGAEVLRQPEGIAAQVFDQRSVGLLRTIDYEAPGAARVEADTLGELADGLGIDAEGFERTVAAFNAAVAARRVRPVGQGRQAHRGHRAAEVQLGAPAGHAARSSGFASRAGSRSRSAACASTRKRACSTAAGARCRACARPASSSAGCSSTTTRAAGA